MSSRTCIPTNRPSVRDGTEIHMDGNEITGQIASSIQSLQALRRSKDTGIRHNRFSNNTWSLIDHRAMDRASSLMSTSRKIFITKWVSKQLPVGSVLVQRKHRIFDTCPMCKCNQEDMEHLLTCLSPTAKHDCANGLENLSSWMSKANTDPITIQHYLLFVLCLRRSQPSIQNFPYPCSSTMRMHSEAFKEQETIGWMQFTEGLISTKWASLQHTYYQKISSQRTGHTWAAHLIAHLWELNFKIWTDQNNHLNTNSTFLHHHYMDNNILISQ